MTEPRKILLTDDGSESGQGCAQALRAKGFELTTCPKDGLEVLRCLGTGAKFDVLIMDTFLTHTDALGVLKEIRAMPLQQKPCHNQPKENPSYRHRCGRPNAR